LSKPFIHSLSCVKRWGGKWEDYIKIHQKMDSTKEIIADNRHRFFFHTSFGVFIIEELFGFNITNSDGKLVSVRDIAERHILEDFGGFIPSPTDYLTEIPYLPWMNGNGRPPSAKNLENIKVETWKKD
jgi:hypothetical protein